ncbi:protein-glutamate O-methyltransferase CheR [Haladaptatus sp. F3-133]|uniref:protein-glutamate O-methyltransferase n=1 Tax=Halorutilus salinus TaxID=2487751 RepID=A0A9Q4C1Y3_9EURY|nr:protein-glutamate O-methyltransferase CheR [Halorutilus salinus]MCX2818415.1 protein-glutamate O-methyltransferase CheR [Halorutilus salinus]
MSEKVEKEDGDSYLDEVLGVVDRASGFEIEYYDRRHLERRVSARMHRTEASEYSEYLNLLEQSVEEREALIESLSVNVTGFFRDPSVWSAVSEIVEDIGKPVEAWSAACSDGREPYSLSMLLERDGIEHEILASDIDEKSLETAYKGVYNSLQTSDINDQISGFDPEMLGYISEENGRYEVNDLIKNITFREHDLIADGPMPRKDIVMCRNLFIYIDPKYSESVYETLKSSLKEGGYLIIGKSESVPRTLRDELELIDRGNSIYVRC